MPYNSTVTIPDLKLKTCPLGCDNKCLRVWINEITGHKIICKCECKHKIASSVEEPEADAIQQSHTVRRTQQYEM